MMETGLWLSKLENLASTPKTSFQRPVYLKLGNPFIEIFYQGIRIFKMPWSDVNTVYKGLSVVFTDSGIQDNDPPPVVPGPYQPSNARPEF